MRLRAGLLFLSATFIATSASAMDLRLGWIGGFGESTVSARGASQSEGPGSFGAYVDYALNSRQTIGLEHIRTFAMKPVSTGVSISGLTARWYILNPVPASLGEESGTSYLYERYIAPYVGLGVGFSQSSLLPTTDESTVTNSVGVYAKARAGVDIPWLNRVGLTAETAVATTLLGFGSVTMLNMTMGIYFYF